MEKRQKIEQYRAQRKQLKRTILEAKKKAWIKMIDELDLDIWDQGYKIITKKFRTQRNPGKEKQLEQAKKLFPKIEEEEDPWKRIRRIEANKIKPFSQEELTQVAGKLKNKKAPGPDGIPPELAKLVVDKQSERFLKIANQAILKKQFPKVWKEARLVLIEKPKKDQEDETSYRPICLLSTLGKILEALIGKRTWRREDAWRKDSTGSVKGSQPCRRCWRYRK